MIRTVVNIGTNLGNIVGATFSKYFHEIEHKDIFEVAVKKFGANKELRVSGWALVPNCGALYPQIDGSIAPKDEHGCILRKGHTNEHQYVTDEGVGIEWSLTFCGSSDCECDTPHCTYYRKLKPEQIK